MVRVKKRGKPDTLRASWSIVTTASVVGGAAGYASAVALALQCKKWQVCAILLFYSAILVYMVKDKVMAPDVVKSLREKVRKPASTER